MEEVLSRLAALEAMYEQAARERDQLLAKVCELEDQVEDLSSQLRRTPKPPPALVSKEPLHINNLHKQTNAQEDEPWLFYCERGKPTPEIQRTLDFSEAFELEASKLTTEEALWGLLLERMYGADLPRKLSSLRKLAAVQLSSACHDQLLLIIRNIPPSGHRLFQSILPQIATLAEFVNIAWSEVENNNPDLLGRIALVLESDNEIKTLTLDRGDTRMTLFVERL